MKKFYYRIQAFSIFSLTFIFLFQGAANAQKGPDKDQIEIVVNCTEYIGDGKLKAHFGYVNTGKKSVVVEADGSVLIYNHGQAKKYGITTFEPGVKDKAFSLEFDVQDQVQWIVTLPSGQEKVVYADINTDFCGEPPSLAIIPGYIPPKGGKQYRSKIGAELTSLYNAYVADPVGFAGATDDIFQLEGDRVLIEAVSKPNVYENMKDSLILLGFVLVTENTAANHVTGWIDIAVLLQLNDLAALRYARPVYPGVSNYLVPATGLTKSQGDFAMHSDFVRLGYELDGTGVKIGVISNSFNSKMTAHIDIANGDLPGATNPNGYTSDVQVVKDLIPTNGTLSDEGRAMLQIVHDVAPGAELAFRTGFLGEQDMALGIQELVDVYCDVIVDDISYITEPFFRDGIIARTIDQVVDDGVTFFSSAGNFGRASYAAQFTSAAAPGLILGEAHDFSGSGDVFQGVELPEGSYLLVLQWDDNTDTNMTTTQTDLDLFLSDDDGIAVLGFNRENVGTFPIEVVPFAVEGEPVNVNVVIARASGPDVPVNFKYILFRGSTQFQMLEYGDQGNSTIVGHPNAEKAISVGAVRYDKNPIFSPGVYEEPVIMSFSSVGGTPVDGVVRTKPDITAPNGVNTTINLGNGDWMDPVDPDTLYPNFFGTSAASPHAAGVAALLIEGNLKYEPGSPLTPEDIRILMKSTAMDMDDPGEDLVSGAGFLQAHKAIGTFATPSPFVENLILASESPEPGDSIVPISFTISGDFFTDSTQVLFRGEVLQEGVVVVDEYTISVEHPGYIGNGAWQAINNAISESELDGGSSEEVFFTDSLRQKVIIKANNTTKKYGEVMPAYSAAISLVTVDDDTLALEDAVSGGHILPLEASRLSGLQYWVPASDTSGAGAYIIVPSLSPAYDPENPLTEIEYAISEKYILEFINGNLTVEKLALMITPNDVEITYGEPLPPSGITFSYEIEDSTQNIGDIGLLLADVQNEHTAALTNKVSLIRGVAVVNGIPLIRGVAVVNGVKLIRGVAVVNGVEVKVEVVGSDTTVYVAGEPVVNGGRLIRGVAVVNGLPFVNMTEIIRGVAVVNGDQVTFDEGYMTELNGVAIENKVPGTRGVALVNRTGYTRGVAIVNGQEVVVENGITTIDGVPVPTEGIVELNGIPIIRGVAVVNSSRITRGVAVVNGVDVPIENGIPSVRGIAVVNGIPMIRGVAVVNNLEIEVIDGEVSQVKEDGIIINVVNPRGVAIVNGVAMVNGSRLTRGVAVVNGIAVVNEAGSGDDVVDLENMNFLASGTAIANGSVPNVRGVAVVNGLEGIDATDLSIAAGTVQDDSSVIYEDVVVNARGIAIVNGLAYVRGVAVVNGSPLDNGNAIVNGSTINNSSNQGTIMVFDATDVGAPAEDASFTPMSFITGTEAGKHWIVPGTYISNNYEISYGLGTLTVDQALLNIAAEDKSKIYGETEPELTYTHSPLFDGDTLTGGLIRDEGEDVDEYAIRQGSVTAGENYVVSYDSAVFTISQAQLLIEVSAENKVYDGNREAIVTVSQNSLAGDTLSISYASALFEDKHVGESKEVSVLGLFVGGSKAGNYAANSSAVDSADISTRGLLIGLLAEDKTYDGNTSALTSAFVAEGLVEGDEVIPSSSGGTFSSRNAGVDLVVTADVSTAGADAGNYLANTTATDTATISLKYLEIGIDAEDKVYDGNTEANTTAFIASDIVDGDDVQVMSDDAYFSTENVGSGILVTADVSSAGLDAVNYISNIEASDTASITPRALEIGISAESKVYDGNVNATTTAFLAGGLVEGDDVTVTSSNGAFSGKDVGSGIVVTALVSAAGGDAPNYAANESATDTASISQKGLEIGLLAEDKIYDGTTSAISTAFIVDGLVEADEVSVSSASAFFSTANVGTDITVTANVSSSGADAGNYMANTSALDEADISPREVTVTPFESFLYIREGDALPVFAFSYLGWIPGDVGNEGYTVLRNSDQASYDPASSESAGTYTVTPVPSNSNYIFTAETGTLHVNPYGPGTRAIKPILNCIREIDTGYYMANFEYKNENDVAVYVPAGEDNLLEGSGIDYVNSDQVPTWFEPGGGSFVVYFFDDSDLSWVVSSRDGDQKVRNAANANSSSTKCKGNYKSATVATDVEEEEQLDPDQLVAYPNPVVDWVSVSMKDIEEYRIITIFDLAGRSYPVKSIQKRADNLDIDMSELPSGQYMIRIVLEESARVVQVIKH